MTVVPSSTEPVSSRTVSVIIPTRNRRDMLAECLRTVYASSYADLEVIVVDNGSTDGTAAMLQDRFPGVVLIRSERNLFAVLARNLGMKRARGGYFLLLDDDNEIDPCMIEELVHMADSDPCIGFAGPKMYYYGTDKLLLYAGARIDPVTSRTVYTGADTTDVGQFETPSETEHIPNAFLMKRAVFEKIGGFDEIYRMSYGEADLPMRGIRAGFKVMYCPRAVTHHKVPPPGKGRNPIKIPMRAYFFARNRVIYMKRFSTALQFAVFMLLFYPFFTFYYAIHLFILKDYASLRYHVSGTLHGLAYGLCGVLRDAFGDGAEAKGQARR